MRYPTVTTVPCRNAEAPQDRRQEALRYSPNGTVISVFNVSLFMVFIALLITVVATLIFASFRSDVMGVGPSKGFGEASTKILAKKADISASGKREVAHFAAGCFWSVEMVFQRIPGVVSTEVGYTQGSKINPNYEQVCSGSTGHTEAVKVTYDTTAIKFDDLLTVYWDILDPTTKNRQGGDTGTQYRSGIYFTTEEQRISALATKEAQQKKYTSPIVTEIYPAAEWFTAETYHQQYLQKGGQCSKKGDLTPIRCYG